MSTRVDWQNEEDWLEGIEAAELEDERQRDDQVEYDPGPTDAELEAEGQQLLWGDE